ncbi:MAG: tetratricopeptide repeat protein [Bacteroidales bacterium]
MKKIIFIITLSIILSETVNATSINLKPILDSAYIAYKNGNYEKCIQLYQQIEKSGLTSAYLMYNMGNAYFRTHQIGKAILYYERAHMLNPSDVDIIHNLQYANTFVTDKINELPKPFYESWFNSLINLFSANRWAWIAIISFLLTLLFIYLNFLITSSVIYRTIKVAIFTSAFVFLIAIIASYSSYHIQSSHNKAIITAEAIEVKNSPDEKGTTLFVIHEGTKVIITDKFEEWAEIRLLDGNTGWIKESNFERI